MKKGGQVFNIKLENVNKIENDDKIVLVDTNYLSEISTCIKKENIDISRE